MARTRRSADETLELKIELAEKKVAKTREANEKAINELKCGAANCDLHKQHFWGGKNDRIKRQVVNQHHIPAVNTALCYHFYESGIPLIAASMMSASMTSFLFCSPIVRASVMTLSISRGIPLL